MMVFFKQLSFLALAIVGAVTATTHCHDENFVPDAVLRVTAENRTQSCLPPKSVVLVNGTSPGPELRLLEGKTYWIRVYNDMPDQNLTMHWHGLTQAVAPFSDGTPSASQWPIPPLHFFDYEVAPHVGMAGTYFYHSHVGFQAVSATGPLIIDDLVNPYPCDEEKIVFIQDVFSKNDTTLEHGLVSPKNWTWSGETSMILVNGKGGGTANGTFCNASLSTINVKPGKTYRLRFIGATALTFASIAIEGHESMQVIAADGSYTMPINTSFLQIGTGQRYDLLLTTLSNPKKSQYYIQLESRERPTLTRGYAILNYGPKPSPIFPPPTPPLTLPNTSTSFLEYALSPLSPSDVSGFPTASEVTRRVTIDIHQHVLPGLTKIVWLQNNYAWTESTPEEPYLVSLYENDSEEFPSMERALANEGLDNKTGAFPAQIGEVLEIILQNTGSDNGGADIHPWHAHGAHYYDIGSGNGTYNFTANELKLAGTTPVKRDTTMLYRYTSGKVSNGTDAGWRAWRIRITDPGVWMVHCHILQHMIMGMQTVWVFGNETDVLGKVPRPDVEGYLVYGGDVNGNETHWPSVVHYNDFWTESQ